MAKELPKLSRNSLDDLFSTQEQRDDEQLERVNIININEIDNFENHPFKIRDDAKMDELVDSIKDNGVLVPCIVRPKQNGRYEMIAGHRRKHAALRSGLEQVPSLVRKLSDDEAVILMVDSNSQRETILPSERAFAYKMKIEAMEHQGYKSNSGLVETSSTSMKTRDIIAAKDGISGRQLSNYIRLTNLLPEILQMVDNSVEKPDDKNALCMAMRPAVELSYLTSDNQRTVLEFMQSSLLTPSHAQAIILRKMQDKNNFSAEAVYELLQQEKPNQKEKVSLSLDKFNRYFPPNTSAKDIEKGIFQALDFYMEAKSRNMEQQRAAAVRNNISSQR